jgi:hypothetical protein
VSHALFSWKPHRTSVNHRTYVRQRNQTAPVRKMELKPKTPEKQKKFAIDGNCLAKIRAILTALRRTLKRTCVDNRQRAHRVSVRAAPYNYELSYSQSSYHGLYIVEFAGKMECSPQQTHNFCIPYISLTTSCPSFTIKS